MRVRKFLMVAGMALALAACSSNDETATDVGQVQIGSHDSMTAGALDGAGATDNQYGPVPGSQQDLVVNIGDRVFFGYDRFDVSAEAQQILRGQADWMNRYPNVNLTIEGHADERGTREYNLALGERRANSVKNYLTGLGVAPNRINVVSYGKERPAVMGSSAEAWAQNRRGVSVVE
jgi:peptidoglycan-associated lipoprotein